MYNANNVYYTEEHSISFGTVSENNFTVIADTWTSWHLIPSSYPVISNPGVEPKLISIPGSDMPIDLTNYLTGSGWPVFSNREGSFGFMIANGFEPVETIRDHIVSTIHGKRLAIRLSDYPDYYYTGIFNVEQVNPGQSSSSVIIKYRLDPDAVALGG